MALSSQDAANVQKLARYRSTRQDANNTTSKSTRAPPPAYTESPQPVDTIQRSRSRYRRPTATSSNKPPLPVGAAHVASVKRPQTAKQSPQPNEYSKGDTQIHVREVHQSIPAPPVHSVRPQHQPSTERLPSRKVSAGPLSPTTAISDDERARLEAKRLMEKEAQRQRKMKEQINTQREEDKLRRREEESAQHSEAPDAYTAQQSTMDSQRQAQQSTEQRPHRSARRENQQDPSFRNRDHTREEARSPRGVEATPKSPRSREFLNVFKKSRGDAPLKNDTPSDTQKLSKLQPYSAPFQDPALPPKTTVNGNEAPVSAVNSGDRQVWVETQGGNLFLSVIPSTTPIDLIQLAANALGGIVNPRSSVLMEKFGKVGVQRPLRRYEHVRDVMNSWDDDRQNSLLLVPSGTGGKDVELEAAGAPSSQPEEFACQLSYSQRPGKWDKRWITLRQDGQVTVAKKEGMKQSDQTNMCHLSDFDIYTPAPKQVARKIKPPKKNCFAIKSQQKSNIFASMESYVHFLCTSDKKTASGFYHAVQSWRSWYLVHVLGEGQRGGKKGSMSAEPRTSATGVARGRPSIGGSQHRRVASDESQYKIGSFKPLVDLDSFTPAADAPQHNRARSRSASGTRGQGFSFAAASGLRNLGGRGAAPPSSFPSNFTNGNTDTSTTAPRDDATFAPGGLLGRTYSRRQADAQARETDRNVSTFKPDQSLLKNAANTLDLPPPRRSIEHTALNTSSDPTLKRSSSQRRPNKPLVDLTPQYREPPQFASRGKGYYPEHITGGLVDSATSPDEVIKLPPSTEWQSRRNTPSNHSPAPKSTTQGVEQRTTSPPRRRNGTMTGGTRVQDVWERNRDGMGLQPGSLLDQVQKSGREHFAEGPAGMKWDRSRATEQSVAYGEAA
ncbi:MAG: hypothetical protein Q9159_007618 [Coniocarpon cinnabarinum]